MFITSHAQGQILLKYAFRFGLDVLPGRFEVLAALASVTVDFGKMFAQLFARPQQSIHAHRRPRFQVR